MKIRSIAAAIALATVTTSGVASGAFAAGAAPSPSVPAQAASAVPDGMVSTGGSRPHLLMKQRPQQDMSRVIKDVRALPKSGVLAGAVSTTTTSTVTSTSATAPLGGSVELTAGLPPAGDQGAVGSCVAWALGYTIAGYFSNTETHAGAPFAPMYLYTKVNGLANVGTAPGWMWPVMQSQGNVPQSQYWQGNYNYWTPADANENAIAANHKIRDWGFIFTSVGQGATSQNAVKGAIAQGYPVAMTFAVNNSFMSRPDATSYAQPGGSTIGFHEAVAVGYDANGLLIQNSWGTWWGGNGLGRVSWAYFNQMMYDGSIMTGFQTGDTNVSPKIRAATAVVGADGVTSVYVQGAGLNSEAAWYFSNLYLWLPAPMSSMRSNSVGAFNNTGGLTVLRLPHGIAPGTYNLDAWSYQYSYVNRVTVKITQTT